MKSARSLAPAALLLGSAVAVFFGWRLFWFLTDDAYIAFRYADQSLRGRGLVWNPDPFVPVEGYTSWLWVVLLRSIWSVTGWEPPAFVNVLSLFFGYATLGVVARLLWRLQLPEPLARRRAWLLVLVLAGTITNRTFLTWLSSGLETSLFNFLWTAWLLFALWPRHERSWVFGLSAVAALAALTRPDGLLLVAASLYGVASCKPREGQAAWGWAWPLLALPVHFVWRHLTYGEWLPNTFHAKGSSPWPQSGWRYALSFVLEYALWGWLFVGGLWVLRKPRLSVATWVALGAMTAQLAYYTLWVGGDHFEYRVYSWLVPLVFLSFVALCGQLGWSPRRTLLLGWILVAASWPIPWVHFVKTRGLDTRARTHVLVQPVAGAFPPLLRSYAAGFDRLQAWLIEHHVGMRHQEHKVFWQSQLARFPSRRLGEQLDWSDRGVTVATSVGVLGWVLPNVAVLDAAGLNDPIVARNPIEPGSFRRMAHDRFPPPGYVEGFQPNLTIVDGPAGPIFVLDPRRREWSDEGIRAWQERFR